jgi:hypothetical protein
MCSEGTASGNCANGILLSAFKVATPLAAPFCDAGIAAFAVL